MATNNKLPNCSCGNNTWEQKGLSSSSLLTQISLHCKSCNRRASSLSDRNNNVFLIFTYSEEIDTTIRSWANDILLPTWRDYQERLEKVQQAINERWLKYVLQELELPEGTTYHTVPEEKKSGWDNMWSLLEHYAAYTNPSSVKKITIPPQLPKQLEAYVKEGEVWIKVDHAESSNQIVPPDPIRTHHDEYYKDVFDTLEKNLNYTITREHVPNEYIGAKNQPWFKFTLGANTITMGPRNRVSAIKLSCNEGFNATKISTAAIDANVSYWGDEGDGMHEWKSKASQVKELEVHARSKEQLVEFLMIICQESLQPAQ